jgi:hypothetical protein
VMDKPISLIGSQTLPRRPGLACRARVFETRHDFGPRGSSAARSCTVASSSEPTLPPTPRILNRCGGRDREFADSPLERTGFEPSVPL